MKKLILVILLFSSSWVYGEGYRKVSKETGFLRNQGCILYVPLNEGKGTTTVIITTTTLDTSTGTLNGGIDTTGWVDGKFRKGLQFDGLDDWVLYASKLGFSGTATSTAVTISCWVSPTKTTDTNQQTIVGKQNDWRFVGIWTTPDWLADFYSANISGGWAFGLGHGMAVPRDIWSHIAFTYDGVTAKIYLNGKLNKQRAVAGTFTNVNWVFLGTTNSTPQYLYGGKMDDVAIFERILSAREINNIYKKSVLEYEQ